MYYKYDEQGFYLEPTLTEEENTTAIQPPQPCWKPQWNGEQWIETASEEEKYPPIEPQGPTLEDRVNANENLLLEILLMG